MDLFLTILLVCFLLTFVSDLIKLLNIPKWWIKFRVLSPSAADQQALDEARAEVEQASHLNWAAHYESEYIRTVKKMRAEKKVEDLKMKIFMQRAKCQLEGSSIEMIVSYAAKGILSVVLLVISVRNRYTPIMVFDDCFNFQPLEGLLNFPTGVHNAISVPVWVLSCNIASRHLSKLIKKTL